MRCCSGQEQELDAVSVLLDAQVFAAANPAACIRENAGQGSAGAGAGAGPALEEASALSKVGAPTSSARNVLAADAGPAVLSITTVDVRLDSI
jgi:hypothetical protein